ncbi:MAG TPA: hypothetical protein VGQ76_18525 [Thermoanaerobaculia bacterium]|jgi:hypothetical protein|nr:hypothetical protein [Thermoanaerobaculia bacterium]
MIITLLTITMLAGFELRAGQLEVDDLHAQWAAAAADQQPELQKQLDKVCGQKDCHASRLYWFTDLEEAKEAARLTGRPILSLHLLGRLDEEMSCANSRFFRTLLYSDDAISSILRKDYVLHWHSVREVPRVTIELGGGRVIRQTITGNSAHYLLDASGRPLDVLPGLYSPAAFRAQLEEWVSLHRELNDRNRNVMLRSYHRQRGEIAMQRATEQGIDPSLYEGMQDVFAAQFRSQSKARTELPVLRQLKRGRTTAAQVADPWRVIGERGKDGIRFSESTLRLMRSKQHLTDAMLDSLRRTVAADTAFNEYDLHLRAHQWFAQGEVRDLYSLNERVYDELFLTPSSDPWLGLNSDDVFTGITESR